MGQKSQYFVFSMHQPENSTLPSVVVVVTNISFVCLYAFINVTIMTNISIQIAMHNFVVKMGKCARKASRGTGQFKQ